MDNHIFHMRLSDGRRVVLPAQACEQLGIDVGDTVIIDVGEHGVQLHSLERSLAEFRAALNKKVPPGVNLVDELLAERRAEAKRE